MISQWLFSSYPRNGKRDQDAVFEDRIRKSTEPLQRMFSKPFCPRIGPSWKPLLNCVNINNVWTNCLTNWKQCTGMHYGEKGWWQAAGSIIRTNETRREHFTISIQHVFLTSKSSFISQLELYKWILNHRCIGSFSIPTMLTSFRKVWPHNSTLHWGLSRCYFRSSIESAWDVWIIQPSECSDIAFCESRGCSSSNMLEETTHLLCQFRTTFKDTSFYFRATFCWPFRKASANAMLFLEQSSLRCRLVSQKGFENYLYIEKFKSSFSRLFDMLCPTRWCVISYLGGRHMQSNEMHLNGWFFSVIIIAIIYELVACDSRSPDMEGDTVSRPPQCHRNLKTKRCEPIMSAVDDLSFWNQVLNRWCEELTEFWISTIQ